MFTGIVEERGEVVALDRHPADARITLRAKQIAGDVTHGDSVAVGGVCLTVVDVDADTFTADVMLETLDRTTLGSLRAGDTVNLERAVTPQTRLGGHIVQGHVDGTGTILDRQPADRWELVRIGLPTRLARYVAEKGSVAVDGVSLTVVSVGADAFTVSLVPTTLERTGLGAKPTGATVNLEVDVVAKYVERLLNAASSGDPATYPKERS